jgi:hypothetical protein
MEAQVKVRYPTFRGLRAMYRPTVGPIRPKISTMPRQQTEAAAFLDIYKLTVEKKRLEQELESLEQRRALVVQRLQVLESAIVQSEGKVQQMRAQDAGNKASQGDRHSGFAISSTGSAEMFETLTLDY